MEAFVWGLISYICRVYYQIEETYKDFNLNQTSMNENHPDSLSPLEQFRRLDVRDRLKVALAGLGIRTS